MTYVQRKKCSHPTEFFIYFFFLFRQRRLLIILWLYQNRSRGTSKTYKLKHDLNVKNYLLYDWWLGNEQQINPVDRNNARGSCGGVRDNGGGGRGRGWGGEHVTLVTTTTRSPPKSFAQVFREYRKIIRKQKTKTKIKIVVCIWYATVAYSTANDFS